MSAMRFRTMLGQGHRRVGFLGAGVGSYPCTPMKDLHRCRRGPHFHLLVDQLIGDTIEAGVEFHVIVDVDLGRQPDRGQLKPLGRQGPQSGPIDLQEQTLPATLPLLKGALIQLVQKFTDGAVQIGQ